MALDTVDGRPASGSSGGAAFTSPSVCSPLQVPVGSSRHEYTSNPGKVWKVWKGLERSERSGKVWKVWKCLERSGKVWKGLKGTCCIRKSRVTACLLPSTSAGKQFAAAGLLLFVTVCTVRLLTCCVPLTHLLTCVLVPLAGGARHRRPAVQGAVRNRVASLRHAASDHTGGWASTIMVFIFVRGWSSA